ncbi:MAG: hypothetical protein ACTTHL_04525 [Oribacterium sp.]
MRSIAFPPEKGKPSRGVRIASRQMMAERRSSSEAVMADRNICSQWQVQGVELLLEKYTYKNDKEAD